MKQAMETMRWNIRLLDDDDSKLLAWLSVFVGGWTLDAAAEIRMGAAESVGLGLKRLIDQGLIEQTALTGTHRCTMPPMVRELAAEMLAKQDEAAAAHAAHCAYYARRLAQREPELHTAQEQAVTQEIAQEIENLRAAWLWAVEHRRFDAMSGMLECLFYYFHSRELFDQGIDLFRRALDALYANPSAEPLLARVLIRLAMMYFNASQYENFRGVIEEGLLLAQKLHLNREIGFGLLLKANARWLIDEGSHDEQIGALMDAAIARMRSAHDQWGTAVALRSRGRYFLVEGDLERGIACLEESAAIARARGDAYTLAIALGWLGDWLSQALGDHRSAIAKFEECLSLYSSLGLTASEDWTRLSLATAYAITGDYHRATELAQQVQTTAREIQSTIQQANALGLRAELAWATGNNREAQTMLNELLALDFERNFYWQSNLSEFASRIALNDGRYSDALQFAREALSIAQQADALWQQIDAHVSLAAALTALCDETAAQHHVIEALNSAAGKPQAVMQASRAIVAYATEVAKAGKPELAVEIATVIIREPRSTYKTKVDAALLLHELKLNVVPQTFAEAQKRAEAETTEQIISQILATHSAGQVEAAY